MGPVLICERWEVVNTFILLSRTRWKVPRWSVFSFGGDGLVKVGNWSYLEVLASQNLVLALLFLCPTPRPSL